MTAKYIPNIVVASYNVLCNEYLHGKHGGSFKRISKPLLNPETRHPAIVERVIGLNADIACLQEVEYGLFCELDAALSKIGYSGRWSHRGRQKRDGCAVFARRQLSWHKTDTYVLAGGKHIMQQAFFGLGDFIFSVANLHIIWDKPGTTPLSMTGLAQAHEALRYSSGHFPPTIVCGDFNAQPESPALKVFTDHRWTILHGPEVMTNCGPSGPLRLDHILCPIAMEGRAELDHTPPLALEMLLPSATEPSDHLPIVATLWPKA